MLNQRLSVVMTIREGAGRVPEMTLPPLFVTQKAVKENCFSKHDNRHSFQSYGVYFGQGLGKRPVSGRRSQHSSKNHTSWAKLASDPHTRSTYGSDFSQRHHSPQSSGPELPKLSRTEPLLTHKFQIFSKSTFHRFPRSHHGPHLPPAPPLSRLAGWYPHCQEGERDAALSPTPLGVLAETQRPFLPHNPWVFSYRS